MLSRPQPKLKYMDMKIEIELEPNNEPVSQTVCRVTKPMTSRPFVPGLEYFATTLLVEGLLLSCLSNMHSSRHNTSIRHAVIVSLLSFLYNTKSVNWNTENPKQYKKQFKSTKTVYEGKSDKVSHVWPYESFVVSVFYIILFFVSWNKTKRFPDCELVINLNLVPAFCNHTIE